MIKLLTLFLKKRSNIGLRKEEEEDNGYAEKLER